MRVFFIILFLSGLTLCSSAGFATKACHHVSKERFVEETLKPANLIVSGEIISINDNTGTEIKLIDVFYKGCCDAAPDTLFISNWRAYRPPLFINKVGDELLFYLEKKDETFRITNLSWAACVPGISSIDKDKGIVKGYERGDDGWYISHEEFSILIDESLVQSSNGDENE